MVLTIATNGVIALDDTARQGQGCYNFAFGSIRYGLIEGIILLLNERDREAEEKLLNREKQLRRRQR